MKVTITATLAVMVHLLVVLGHGLAHHQLQIQANMWQGTFIAVVIFIGPRVAMALLWTRLQRMGLTVLLLTMAGSLFFGVGYHFFAPGPDNALELPPGHWEWLFKTSATWLAVLESGTVAWCVWALKITARRTDRHSVV
jgi:hypothetical protein